MYYILLSWGIILIKKQFKMIVLASLLVLVMQLVGCGEVELTIKPNPATTIEQGSEKSQDVNDYMTVTVGGKEVKNQEGIVVDTSQVDTTKVGMYMLNIIYKDHLSILNVAVIDATVSAMDKYGNETTKTVYIEASAVDAEALVVSVNDISAVD